MNDHLIKIQKGIRQNSIDALKAFAAIGVVLIHFGFPGLFGKIIQVIARVGVPIFFMCSGYYLNIKNLNSKTIQKKINHILSLLIGSIICYVLFNMFLKGCRGVLTDITIPNLLKFLIFNAPQISSAHLWFLSALIYSYIIVYQICMVGKGKYCLTVAIVLLSIHIIIAEVIPHCGIQVVHPFVRNAYLFGVPFLLIGVWISENMKTISEISGRFLVCLTIGGLILAIAENMMLSPNDLLELYIGNIIASTCLFLLCIKYPNKKCGKMYLVGKKYSLVMYIFHPMIGTIVESMIKRMQFTMWIISWIKPLLVILLSLLVAIIADKIITRKMSKKVSTE